MIFSLAPLDTARLMETALLWAAGWRDAHAAHAPPALAALRTLEDFQRRLALHQSAARIAVADARVLGLCITKDTELYQLYVDADARGAGVAQALMADAEARMRADGVTTAWLACAKENHRAARFYGKCGWHSTGIETVMLDASGARFALDVLRFEKPLAG